LTLELFFISFFIVSVVNILGPTESDFF
jgi:hypothetical protein